ncbi:hypothetical protein [Cupriavidus sp. D39]|uniref:hypothetical protein n=1 Tax=Cupriavidus sp. D39 TaxID=2997877 RepID=UPI0022700632|nr:hypothetical protein [Cupriavidus sp. D39]MCY0854934.1 hypothetical protein [Cupriavidus sp. D39]
MKIFSHSDWIGDNALRIKAIADTPGALVYVFVGEAERKAKAGASIKLLPVDGIEATSQNVRPGSFPISRPLTLITPRLPKGLTKTLSFAGSGRRYGHRGRSRHRTARAESGDGF